ncbi:tyrosine-type recombinase/integrase [Rhizobium leguminosarum]|uniref:tyrosine-type recombinase/integrase n=1 Tax=Rhizobium leguminosarum TaxID=384 RepID=UPI001F3B8274|nr:site-specific integrase [Rhizobium leguminosarum]UIJ81940.1 site-specific integrase [Rhizobium leguminosarum]
MPFLVPRSIGLPIEAPSYWITAHRRAVGSQPNTLFNELRSLMILYLWADLCGIDVIERITEGAFFTLDEIIDLVNVSGWYLNDLLSALERRSSNVITLARHIPKSGVDSGEKRNRLSVIRSFLEFTSSDYLSKLQGTPNRWLLYRDMRAEFLKHLATYISGLRAPNRDDVGDREGLDREVLTRLRAVIDPDHPDNPFEPQVRFRNFVIIRLLIDLGIRRGELLGIMLSDCDVTGPRGYITIHRRPDNVHDTRITPGASTKTAARKLELSARTTQLVYEWIVHHRSKLPGATKAKGQFLIVSIPKGEPMSPSNVNKMFEALRRRVPGLPEEVAPHVLRHSWNDTFSEHMDKNGVSEEDEVKFRQKIMGWRDEASARFYLRRTVARRSNEVLREMHDNLDIRVESEGQKR